MKIDSLIALWPEFLAHEKSQQSWLSAVGDALLSSNFLAVVHAFRKYACLKDSSFLPFDEISLPEMTDEFLFKDISVACDAGLEVRASRAAKHSFFNSVTLSIPLGGALEDYTYSYFDEATRRMILACPPEDYNAESAFKILQSFSEKELSMGLEHLKEIGTISKNKAQTDAKTIPGLPTRGVSLSEKFVSFFGRYLPDNFYKNAVEYRLKLMDTGEYDLPQVNSSGSFAALYDLIVSGNLLLMPELPILDFSTEERESAQNVTLKLISPAIHSPTISKRKTADFPGIDAGFDKRQSVNGKGKGPAFASERQLQQISSDLGCNFQLLSSLYSKIRNSESIGISYIDLLSSYGHSSSDLEQCLIHMAAANLIDEVGFSHPRYVARMYTDDWKVAFSQSASSTFSFLPLIYSRFDGTLNKKVYRACSQSVLGMIAQKPGISFAGISKRSKSVLNPFELHKLLEGLITNGFVKKISVPVKLTNDPFGDLFEESKSGFSSCYFPLKDFYKLKLY